MVRQKSVSGAWCSVPKEVSRGVFLTSVFWFVFLATARNEQETQSKAQTIRNCYYSEKTENKKCMVLKKLAMKNYIKKISEIKCYVTRYLRFARDSVMLIHPKKNLISLFLFEL